METKVSHARFFALLKQLPYVTKDDLVWEYSHTVTTSLNEFYSKMPAEYARMINDMQRIANSTNASKPIREDKTELKRLRSAILHRLQKHGVDTTDWEKVNKFMSQPRIAGKTLGKMTIEEMQTLIPKLESILTKDKAKQNQINHLAQCN